MTGRLAPDMGMAPVTDIGERMGIYENLDPTLAMSLGAGETTLMDLIGAYGAMINGGGLIEPALIDRVQNRSGDTIYIHDGRECLACDVETGWDPSCLL